MGEVEPIRSTQGDFIYLSRGFPLDEDQLDVLLNNLPHLMESCFYQHPSAALKMNEFVDYLVQSPKEKSYIQEVLKTYPLM